MKKAWSQRIVLSTVLLVALVMLPAASQSAATKLRLGHIFPTNHPTHTSVVAMAKVVDQESNGRLIIEVHPNAAMGKEDVQAQNISLGTLDMGTAGPGMISRVEPAWGLIAGEYVFKNVESMFKVMNGPIGEDIKNRMLAKRGIRTLSVAYVGERHLTANKPIYKPEDLKGLKIRIPNIPLRKATFIALGAAPTPMAFAEVYLGLQQRVIDGQENPLAQIVSMKFYEVQKYLMLTGHALNSEILLMNEKKFQSLPEDLRAALAKGAKVYERTQWEEYKKLHYGFLEKVLDEGMVVLKPDLEAFRKAVRDVPYQFEKEWGEGLYDKVLKAQE